MLGIQRLASLAEIVDFELGELKLTAEFASRDITELMAWDPAKKPRPVISVGGKLRVFQNRLYHRRLKERLQPCAHSFGGVAGRHIVFNAERHIGHQFIYKADIANFFPSITIDRVNRLFLHDLGCSYEVSRFLTRLCTHDYHLALGLVTSPILADQILRQVDNRIAGLCENYALTASRFVDDLTISGNFDIEKSPVPDQIRRILNSHGFRQKSAKSYGARLDESQTITGLRLKQDRVDVAKDYLAELDRQLVDHASLASGGQFDGPLQSASQLAGRVNYVSWINHNRRFGLKRKLNAIRWPDVWREAAVRGLVQASKILTLRDEPAPDYAKCYGASAHPASIPNKDIDARNFASR